MQEKKEETAAAAEKKEEVKEEKEEKKKKEEEKEEVKEIVVKVDMHCEACARKVARALKGFQGYFLLIFAIYLFPSKIQISNFIIHL